MIGLGSDKNVERNSHIWYQLKTKRSASISDWVKKVVLLGGYWLALASAKATKYALVFSLYVQSNTSEATPLDIWLSWFWQFQVSDFHESFTRSSLALIMSKILLSETLTAIVCMEFWPILTFFRLWPYLYSKRNVLGLIHPDDILQEASSSAWSFARGWSIRMIICKRSFHPDDHFRKAGRSGR